MRRPHSRRSAALRLVWLTLAAVGLVQACSRTDVTGVAVTSVTVSPPALTMAVGETRTFTAVAQDDEGTPLPSSLVVWSSSDPATLSVGSGGSVQALRGGSAKVWATAREIRGEAVVTVQAGPAILAATTTVEMFAQLDGGSAGPFEVAIENAGSGTLTGLSASIRYANGQPTGWLAVALSSTTAPAILRISANTSPLSLGDYDASVIVESPMVEGTLEIQVALSVTEDRPILRLSPPAVSFAASSGSAAPAPRIVSASNIGGGALTDMTSAVVYQGVGGWLTATLSSTSAPADLTLRADPSDLESGTYRATVRVESPAAANSPVEVAVTFAVDVEPEADLSVTKSSSESVILGDTAVFVLTVQNGGPRDALNVVLVDSLPDGLTFARASSGGLPEGDAVRWSLGTVPAGATIADTLRARAVEIGTHLNVARVSTSTPDPVSGNDRDIRSLRVEPVPTDLRIEKTGPPTADVGDTIRYVITFSNLGPATARNVVVTDSIPVDVTFIRATANGVLSGREVRWTLPTMAPGISRTDTAVVRVEGTGQLTDVATISSDAGDPQPGSNRAVVTTTTEAADLRLAKAGPASAVAGEDVAYVLTVANDGPSFARNVVVEDTLPPGATFVSASGGATHSGGIVTWPPIAILSPTLSVDYEVVVRVPTSASGVFRNAANVGSDVTDPDPGNNRAESYAALAGTVDLAIVKSGPTDALAGTDVTYKIEVDHLGGPSDAQGVVVTDVLPSTLSFVSATGGGVYDETSRTVSWDLGTLEVGGAVELELVARTGRGVSGNVTNTAQVTSVTPDAVPPNNQSSVTTAVVRQADLAITKTAPETVVAGTGFTYTIDIEHVGGPSNSLGVVVTDVLPSTLSFVSATGGGVYDDDTRTVTWNLPNIVVGAGSSVELEVALAAEASGSVSNTAVVATNSVDPVPENDESTVSRSITSLADIAATKSGPPAAGAGESIEYEVSVRNDGPSSAASVVLIDSIPAGAGFVSATGGGAHSGGQITWPTISSLGVGETRSFKVVVSVPPGASSTVTNIARASSASGDPDPSNNRATATTTIGQSADIRITKTGPDSVVAGTNAVYVVRVFNDGPSTASGVVVIDSIPPGTGYVGATGEGTHSGGQVTWPTIASLDSGGSVAFAVAVSVPSGSTGTITNVAKASATTGDPDGGNNRAIVTTPVTQSADLRVTKTGPETASSGGVFAYTITVDNVGGPSDAGDVVVTDFLPESLIFVSGSGGASYAPGQHRVRWNMGALPVGGSVEVTLTVRTDPAFTATVTNTASVSSATRDPSDANNQSTAMVSITPTADLEVVEVSGTPGVVTAGSDTELVYTILIRNNGPSVGGGVVVTDVLPSDVTFVAATADGIHDGGTVTWNLGTLAPGQTVELELSVTVDQSRPIGLMTNAPTVSTTAADPTPANNTEETTTLILSGL